MFEALDSFRLMVHVQSCTDNYINLLGSVWLCCLATLKGCLLYIKIHTKYYCNLSNNITPTQERSLSSWIPSSFQQNTLEPPPLASSLRLLRTSSSRMCPTVSRRFPRCPPWVGRRSWPSQALWSSTCLGGKHVGWV